MSNILDYRSEHDNTLIDWKEYKDLVKENKRFYSNITKLKNIKKDIDLIAFLGLQIGVTESFPYKTIPYGDRIVEAFTVGQFRYMKTFTGYFFLKIGENIIRPIPQSVYDEKRTYRKFFNAFSSFPQAGLTRGSKSPFLTSQKTKNERDF